MHPWKGIVGLLVAAAVAAAPPARAFVEDGDDSPRHALVYRGQAAGQANPLGLQLDLLPAYRYRLYDNPRNSLLLRGSFLAVGPIVRVNPAYARAGFGVEAQPLALLTLRAQYEHRDYFGTANMLQSWPSPYDEHDDDTNRARGRAGLNYAGRGHQVSLLGTLRGRVGPVVFVDDLEAYYFRLDLAAGDRVFYDAFLDTLVPGDGWALANHAHLLWLARPDLLLGVRGTSVFALYPEAWLDGARGNPNTPSHKIGPIVAYRFGTPDERFRQPTLILCLNWWLRSRYRTGEDVSQAIPYGVIALQWSGDLLAARSRR